MPKNRIKNRKSKNNENVVKAMQTNDKMQHQKRGESTVKPLKQTDTVEVVSSNLTVPTIKIKGLWFSP
jgi:hypothetical protein